MPTSRDAGRQATTAFADVGRHSALGVAPWLNGWLLAVVLVAAVFMAYQPAWHGDFLWDDDEHVTKPALQSLDGLYRIWFDVGATLQYYPLLHSAFWAEHKVWGDATLGYHVVNIALHCLAALMVAVILRRLAVPGAYLAAAIFALHPVHVESVAWIAEQKNTLSAAFYLAALLTYLRFDQSRRTLTYCGALGLFVLGILSKTVIATLPGALLVIFWWQRGRLSWKKDVLPLLPFFVVGAGGGMITVWWELELNHCVGPDFTFTPVERLLIAGRAVWFHLWKLFWPTRLTFIYPRWQIDATAWWQYLFPLGAAALLAALWAIRRWTRAPLAALLFFVGTLFPVLGFFNLYTFRYSLIANHYQYLASIGIIALVSAGVTWLLQRWRLEPRRAGYAVCAAALATLAGMTWQQSRMYADSETLYRDTIAQNPDCWMAHNNLGIALGRRGQLDECVVELHKTLALRPQAAADVHNDLGNVLKLRGQLREAIAHYEQALQTQPDSVPFHINLANALKAQGRVDDAVEHYRRALELEPDCADANSNLGMILVRRGQIEAAAACFRKAVQVEPDRAEARCCLGDALIQQGKVTEAITQWREAIRLRPNFGLATDHLAWTLATCPDASIRNAPAAVELAGRAVRLSGGRRPAPLDTLAAAYAEAGRFSEAAQTAQQAHDLAVAQGKTAFADAIEARVRLYQAGTPYREPRAEPRE